MYQLTAVPEGFYDCFAEMFLIFFHDNRVPILFRDDVSDDLLLTTHRIDRNNTPLKNEQLQEFWHGRYFSRLVRDFLLGYRGSAPRMLALYLYPAKWDIEDEFVTRPPQSLLQDLLFECKGIESG